MQKTPIVVGIMLMFLGASTMVSAYHVDYPGPAGFPANDWSGAVPGLITCESTGSNDPVNPLPVAVGGEGGLCYASSQDFADCVAVGLGDFDCTHDKAAKKAKKPDQDRDETDWGYIEPKCVPACDPNKNDTGVGEDWFIRINSNTRSCNGAWGQTFVYKESIAYWSGAAPNENGISGHVTFFVDDLDASEGTYNRDKAFADDSTAAGVDATKTPASCTSNGQNWGVMDDSLKP